VGFTRAPDAGYTDLLKAAGHNVTRFQSRDDADVSSLADADLIIISRSVASGHYQQAGETAAWNGLNKPVMIMGGYILRSSRLGFTTGSTIPDTAGTVHLTVNDPSHPIFAGVALDANNTMVNSYGHIVDFNGTAQRGISVNTDPIAGGGTVLAVIGTAGDPATGGMIIGEWSSGGTLANGSADVLGGPRLVFLSGSREQGITSEGAGIYDLDPDGEQLFLNAVAYMSSLGTPTGPAFTAISQSGGMVTFEWSGGGSLERADSVSGPWTAVPNASSPFTTPASGASGFFRLRQ
jgi:ribosomal protein L31